MYDKQRFNKFNDKKILHKVKKQWVTISIALFTLIGGSALVSHTSASANQSNNDNNTNHQNNINPNANINNQAQVMHQRLMINVNNQPHMQLGAEKRTSKPDKASGVTINKKTAYQYNNVNHLKTHQAGMYHNYIYSRINLPFRHVRINHTVELHNSVDFDNSKTYGSLLAGQSVHVQYAFREIGHYNNYLRYEVNFAHNRMAYITGNPDFVSYVVPKRNYHYYQNKTVRLLRNNNSKVAQKIIKGIKKLLRRHSTNYRAYANLYQRAFDVQQHMKYPLHVNYHANQSNYDINSSANINSLDQSAAPASSSASDFNILPSGAISLGTFVPVSSATNSYSSTPISASAIVPVSSTESSVTSSTTPINSSSISSASISASMSASLSIAVSASISKSNNSAASIRASESVSSVSASMSAIKSVSISIAQSSKAASANAAASFAKSASISAANSSTSKAISMSTSASQSVSASQSAKFMASSISAAKLASQSASQAKDKSQTSSASASVSASKSVSTSTSTSMSASSSTRASLNASTSVSKSTSTSASASKALSTAASLSASTSMSMSANTDSLITNMDSRVTSMTASTKAMPNLQNMPEYTIFQNYSNTISSESMAYNDNMSLMKSRLSTASDEESTASSENTEYLKHNDSNLANQLLSNIGAASNTADSAYSNASFANSTIDQEMSNISSANNTYLDLASSANSNNILIPVNNSQSSSTTSVSVLSTGHKVGMELGSVHGLGAMPPMGSAYVETLYTDDVKDIDDVRANIQHLRDEHYYHNEELYDTAFDDVPLNKNNKNEITLTPNQLVPSKDNQFTSDLNFSNGKQLPVPISSPKTGNNNGLAGKYQDFKNTGGIKATLYPNGTFLMQSGEQQDGFFSPASMKIGTESSPKSDKPPYSKYNSDVISEKFMNVIATKDMWAQFANQPQLRFFYMNNCDFSDTYKYSDFFSGDNNLQSIQVQNTQGIQGNPHVWNLVDPDDWVDTTTGDKNSNDILNGDIWVNTKDKPIYHVFSIPVEANINDHGKIRTKLEYATVKGQLNNSTIINLSQLNLPGYDNESNGTASVAFKIGNNQFYYTNNGDSKNWTNTNNIDPTLVVNFNEIDPDSVCNNFEKNIYHNYNQEMHSDVGPDYINSDYVNNEVIPLILNNHGNTKKRVTPLDSGSETYLWENTGNTHGHITNVYHKDMDSPYESLGKAIHLACHPNKAILSRNYFINLIINRLKGPLNLANFSISDLKGFFDLIGDVDYAHSAIESLSDVWHKIKKPTQRKSHIFNFFYRHYTHSYYIKDDKSSGFDL